jgi:hypothetical protein
VPIIEACVFGVGEICAHGASLIFKRTLKVDAGVAKRYGELFILALLCLVIVIVTLVYS